MFNGKIRKYYSITPKGKRYLERAKRQIGELVREVFTDEDFSLFLDRSAPNQKR